MLEAVIAGGEGVQVALYAHSPHLFPAFDRIHRSPAVRIAVDENHRGCLEVEGEFRYEYVSILVASVSVVIVNPVSQGVGWIYAHSPLHVARHFPIELIYRPIGPVQR